jgi:Leucine-rich repeat (LRR) protein
MKTKLHLLLLLANFSIYAQTNLVSNAGFENWIAGVPQNWTISNSVTSNGDANTGLYSAKLSFTTLSPKIITQVPMKAGVTYTVKFKYKFVSSNYGGDHPIALNISKNGSSSTLSTSTFATNNLWTEKATTFTPDNDLSYDLSISTFSFDGASFIVLIDDIEVYVQGAEQYTLIPDANFENKLISLGFDSGTPDGRILTSRAALVTYLNLYNSSITDLTGIEAFVSLKSLDCSTNRLTRLNVSKNSALNYLDCSNNLITALDLSNNTLLLTARCIYNKLTALDFSNNTALTSIRFGHNQLTSINVSKQSALEELDCSYNSIKVLDVTSNLNLWMLMCDNNLLESLNLSKNTKLTYLFANINRLTSLNIQNGTNYLFNPNTSVAAFYGNPDLRCIQVDNVAEANERWVNRKDAIASFSTDCAAYTLIPDTNFEKKLIALGIDKDGANGKVLTSNIASVTYLNITHSSITDLTGIQDFRALTNLYCYGNQIANLDISNNLNLSTLSCGENKLTSLNVSSNLALKSLTCSYTQLSTIDVSRNLALEELNVSVNNLINIDVSKNLLLKKLEIANNNIPAIDVTPYKDLETLSISYTKITNIDVSQNLKLTSLLTAGNKSLKSLDVTKNTALKYLLTADCLLSTINVSQNKALEILDIGRNKIETLDVSNNPALTSLYVESNLLTSINLNNNNNTLLTNTVFFGSNPKLYCIQVDNVEYANTNWSDKKDITTNFSSTPCPSSDSYTLIPDINFENKLISSGVDTGVPDGRVLTANVRTLTNLSLSNSSIKNLTGIEDFKELRFLDIRKNQIETLDLSSNTKLLDINASENGLTTLNVSKNILLTNLLVSKNQLTTLDLSKNTLLKLVQCTFNKLTNLNINNASLMTILNCGNNELTSLDVSNNIALIDLTCEKNSITSLNVTNNKALEFLYCSANKLTSLDVTKNINLWALYCDMNQLTTLNVSKNTLLNQLYVYNNSLTAIDVSKNTELSIFYCFYNQLTSVDISNNPKITYLQADLNKLTSLNLKNGKNTIIDRKYTNFNNNPNLTCIIVDDVAYSNANWSNLKDATASYAATCSTLGLENSIFDKVAVYPNPTKGEVNINNIALEKATVYNSLGQLVKTFVLDPGDTNNTINLSGLPKGIYYVYLINEDAASAKKIILE